MIRSFGLTVLMTMLAMVPANGQQAGSMVQTVAEAPGEPAFPGKEELLRRIGLYEDAERSAQRTHPGLESMVKIYANLAGLYEDVGMYPQSEDQMRREIALLRGAPQGELAEAYGHLAVLHLAMNDLRAAEKDELEALRIRQSVGDAAATALTWSDLADVYVKQRQFKKAQDYAQRAIAALPDGPKVDVADRIAPRQALALALCGLKQCGQAIPLLRETLEMQTRAYGADSLIVGTGHYLLGYVYWQNGNMDEAATLMAQGTARMKIDLGWGHAIYVDAMSQYAKFLRERGQMEEAAAAQREVRQAQSVVDVRSLATQTAFAAH